jgi:hypothetical protein
MSPTTSMIKAVQCGNTQGVQLFLESTPSKSDVQKMIYVAALNGHTECVKMMLPHSLVPGSQMNHNDALISAAYKGHDECVKLLIPVCNPLAYRSAALCAAVESGNQRCVDLLLPVSNTQAALAKLQSEYSDDPGLYEDLQHIIAQQQKQILEDTVGDISSARGVRKI